MPARAVFLDYASLDLGDLDPAPLRAVFDELELYPATASDEIAARLAGAQVAIVNKVVLDAQTLAACPELKLVLVSATGTNNIDLEAARAQGVRVCNCQGYGTASVAQHTLALLLALATRLPDYQADIRAGRWQTASQLGSAVKRLAEAFGMQTLVGQLPGRPARPGSLPLAELLPQVDALTMHCPLTEQTRGLIGATELAAMKSTAFLVNTARGGIVDEQALADCLRRGHLAGAATDVFSVEPPRDGNPLLAGDIPRLIVTPHNAWGSREARQRIIGQLADNAQGHFAGTPQRVVC